MKKELLIFFVLFQFLNLSSQEIGDLEMTDCFLENCSFMEEFPDTEFGYFTVPEDYSKPDGKTIKIAFSIIKATEANKKTDPIIYFTGGWGPPSIENTGGYLKRFPFRDRDVIFFDYRGSGFSTALPCKEIGQQSWEEILSDLPYAEHDENMSRRFSECINEMEEKGIDYNQYGMATINRDAAFLAQELPYNTYNLYGVSYGTMAIQHFLRASKDYNITVRSAILDSSVPIGRSNVEVPMHFAKAFDKLTDECKNDPSCNAEYPNLKERYLAFLNDVDKNQLEIQFADGSLHHLNRQEINAAVHQLLYSYTQYKSFPIFLETLMARDAIAMGKLTEHLKNRVVDGFNALGLSQFNADTKKIQEESKVMAENIKRDYAPYEVLYPYVGYYLKDTKFKMDSIANSPIQTDVPSLLLGGTFDPITPYKWNDDFRKNFSNHYYKVLPKVGHGASFHPCGKKTMELFMANPLEDPNPECLENSENFEIDFTLNYYKNAHVSRFFLNIVRAQNPIVLIIFCLICLGILFGGVFSAIRIRKSGSNFALPLLVTSVIAIIFIGGLFYFANQTLTKDSFLIAFGLVGESIIIFWLVPVMLLLFLWFLFKFINSTRKPIWTYIPLLAMFGLFGIIVTYHLFPNF